MNDRRMEFRVGVVVFATAIIAGLLATLNNPLPQGWLTGRGTYQINIELQQAPGIGPGSPVRKSGLLIGQVKSIEDLDDRIVVHARIDAGRRLFPQYQCQIRTSVLGDATIEFVTTPVPPGTPPLADGATVRGEVVGNPLDMLTNMQGDLKVTIDALGRAGNEVANLAQRVDHMFGPENGDQRLPRLIDRTEVAMAEFGKTMTSVNEILGGNLPEDKELRGRLRQSLGEMPETIHEARASLQDFRVVLRSADKNLQNLEGLTEPLGRKGGRITDSIAAAVEGVETLVEELTVLGEALNSREGTLGQLLHNPQLYENANRLICNANQVVVRVDDMAKRLQVVIEDARVFMDKIAREPGRIVGGAFSPSIQK